MYSSPARPPVQKVYLACGHKLICGGTAAAPLKGLHGYPIRRQHDGSPARKSLVLRAEGSSQDAPAVVRQ